MVWLWWCGIRMQVEALLGCNMSNKKDSLARRGHRSVDDVETYITQVGYESVGFIV